MSRCLVIMSRDEVPHRLVLMPDDALLVRNYDLAELLIARGADSRRIGISPEGLTPAWHAAVEAAGSGGVLVPPTPCTFPGNSVILLPTYNERSNIQGVLEAIFRHLHTDVLVIDDNSPDGTGDLARNMQATYPGLQVLGRAGKEGLGKAYIAGFRWALERNYDRIFQMDCDFSHAPWDLPRFAHASTQGSDVVIGSRYIRGGRTPGWSRRRRLLSKAGNTYARLFLKPSIHDWTTGFRCWQTPAIRGLDLDGIGANGYSFLIELLWRSVQQGRTVRELPITFAQRAAGTSKMSSAIIGEALRLVPRLRWGR